ncbi:XdhC family protein [Evansella tamaricis]|uniref:XdhC family protein n=1 Tax=Evansella tamaricis TaxID=2069301 RepID=A0ABS6JNC5_9BACI|nr:XdhC family protein [Evansella tamaricis]MBU9713915.1 XdhC family protein [Evansella tamaricis]
MQDYMNYLQIIKECHGEPFVLATVMKVEGSAYRHEGAKMLFSRGGDQYGMISGGCLESDLGHQAMEVLQSKSGKTVTYDLRDEDDAGWGQGAGCNGKVTVILEIVTWDERSYLPVIWNTVEGGRNVISIRKVQDGKMVDQPMLFSEDGSPIWHGDKYMTRKEHELLHSFINSDLSFESNNNEAGKEITLLERYNKKDTLYIFGAGVDVEPIARRAAQFYFSPIIIDPRESRCREKYFPDAEKWIVEHPEKFASTHSFKDDSYILIMTHQFLKDQYLLNHFVELETPPKYVGVLGPRRRTERLLTPKEIPDWVHSPVGVDIYAEGAEEISISILGELIRKRNEKRTIIRKQKREMCNKNLAVYK